MPDPAARRYRDCPIHGSPDECRPCWYCGTYTDDYDYIGRQRVALCSAKDCGKETARASREAEEAAALDAAEDGYERYF